MHILLFNFFPKPNPIHGNMAQALRRRGHVVWVASLSEDNKLAWHDGEKVVAETKGPAPVGSLISRMPVVRSVARRIISIFLLLRIQAFANSCGADIVQVDPGSMRYVWLLPMRKRPGVYYFLDIRHINRGIRRGWYGRFREESVIFEQRISGKYFFDYVFFNHPRTAQAILGEGWQERADIIPVGIKAEFLEIAPRAPDARDPLVPVRFIYVGAITRFRELEFLLQAIKQALIQTDRFHVRLIGPDVDGDYYRQLVESMGISAVVSIDPPIPNDQIPALMAGHHVGLAYTPPNRTTWDYQPTIKALEYRALGLPILSLDVATHHGIIEDGINGILIPHTVEALTDGLLRFINDREFLAACTEHAKQMRTAVTLEDIARMYEQAYERMLLNHRQSGQAQPREG